MLGTLFHVWDWIVIRFIVLAEDVEEILDGMKGAGESEALSPMTTKIQEIGGGGYRIVFMIACFVFVIGLVAFFVKMFTANSQERSFMKWDIVWKAAAIACAFGAIAIVAMLARFGANLFGS